MPTPSISVIIPVYNQALYLPEAIDSVLAQTHPSLEVIVVNDGSTDGTPSVMEIYGSSICCLHQENRGLASARNAGFLASHGDYVIFFDSDDRMTRQMLSRLSAELTQRPECGLAYCAWQQIDRHGAASLGEVHPSPRQPLFESLLLRRFFFFSSSALLRRACLEQVGLFDESLRWGEDADLWLRILRAGCDFAYLDEPLLSYRVQPASLTSQVSPAQVQGWQAGLEKFFADPSLPPEIAALRGQAEGVLHFETAGRYLRLSQPDQAAAHLRLGAQAWQGMDESWWLEWLAGTALDPRTPDPLALIRLACDVLPLDARFLLSSPAPRLRRQVQAKSTARYYLAGAFAAYQGRDFPQAVRKGLLALKSDPTHLRNRGFLRILFSSASRILLNG